MNKRYISILTGAGASIKAGMPTTEELTCRIRSGEGFMRHSDCNYYLSEPPYGHIGEPDDHVPRVSKFADRIYYFVESYYSKFSHNPSYEDIYYLAWQVYQEEYTSTRNPAIRKFVSDLEEESKNLLTNAQFYNSVDWNFSLLVKELTNYMECVVSTMLNKQVEDTSYLKFISDIHVSDKDELCGVLTLNHDNVLESFMTRASIPYFNGFAKQENGDFLEWIGFDVVNRQVEIPLVKLHGSISWYRFPTKESFGSTLLEVKRFDKVWEMKDDNGNKPWSDHERPEILMGTSNKLQAYNFGHYVELYSVFHKILSKSNILVVVGYSFGDRGVDASMRSWIDSDKRNQLVIINPEIERLIYNSIDYDWIKRRYERSSQISLISKKIEEVSIDEMIYDLPE